jgi:transposase
LSEQRTYRQFTPEQKAEIVLAGLRGDRSVRDVCREYQIAETLSDQWRERLLEGGEQALANPCEKTPEQPRARPPQAQGGQLERALGRKTYEPGGGGERSRGWE